MDHMSPDSNHLGQDAKNLAHDVQNIFTKMSMGGKLIAIGGVVSIVGSIITFFNMPFTLSALLNLLAGALVLYFWYLYANGKSRDTYSFYIMVLGLFFGGQLVSMLPITYTSSYMGYTSSVTVTSFTWFGFMVAGGLLLSAIGSYMERK